MDIDDTNSYESEYVGSDTATVAKFATGYYYDNASKSVYSGESLKVLWTIEVPSGDLDAGKTVKFSSSFSGFDGLGLDQLSMTTDDFIHCSSAAEIAEAADPASISPLAQRANTRWIISEACRLFRWRTGTTRT